MRYLNYRYWLCLAILPVFAACVDRTSSPGEEGRLFYSIYSEYDVPEVQLTEARIVAGHEQHIMVSLTAQGRKEVDYPDQIQHTVIPADGATIVQGVDLGEGPPDFRILATNPGIYTVESSVAGELVDRIELDFAAPAGFDLATHVREPWGEIFDPAFGDPIVVVEGSQVTFQSVAVDENNDRLVGDLTTTLSVDPDWAVVPGQGVIETYEGGVWTVGGEANFYFIDPALVTFTVTDPVSGATGTQTFDVTPVVP